MMIWIYILGGMLSYPVVLKVILKSMVSVSHQERLDKEDIGFSIGIAFPASFFWPLVLIGYFVNNHIVQPFLKRENIEVNK